MFVFSRISSSILVFKVDLVVRGISYFVFVISVLSDSDK